MRVNSFYTENSGAKTNSTIARKSPAYFTLPDAVDTALTEKSC
jgi:hypothetical protein